MTAKRTSDRPRSLPGIVKVQILHGLGGFNTPSEVVDDIKRQHGLQLSRQSVERYDPTKAAGSTLSAGLKSVFWEARHRALADLQCIPIAHRAWRLRKLDAWAHECMARDDLALAMKLLEQAAREVGAC